MSITEQILSAIIKEREKDIQHFRALLKEAQDDIVRLRKAGDAMDNAISDIDPQRAERHRFMKLTDAEYIAVTKWRTAKDPNYNKA